MKDYALTCVIDVKPEVRDYQTYEAQSFEEALAKAFIHIGHLAVAPNVEVRIVCLKEIEAVENTIAAVNAAYDDYVKQNRQAG